jgi:hypothetical protein
VSATAGGADAADAAGSLEVSVIWLAAGSSATATAATASSDAGTAAEAFASGSGAVPPCFSSVKWSFSCRGFAPLNQKRLERRSSRFGTIKWSVAISSAVRSFVASGVNVLFSCPAARAGRV